MSSSMHSFVKLVCMQEMIYLGQVYIVSSYIEDHII